MKNQDGNFFLFLKYQVDTRVSVDISTEQKKIVSSLTLVKGSAEAGRRICIRNKFYQDNESCLNDRIYTCISSYIPYKTSVFKF